MADIWIIAMLGILLMAAFYSIGAFIMRWLAGEPTTPVIDEYRIMRMNQLENGYNELENWLGRPPTAEELWEAFPPKLDA